MARSSYVTLIVAMATSAALATAVAIVAAEVPAVPIPETSASHPMPDVMPVLDVPALGGEHLTRSLDEQQLVGVSSCAASGCHGSSKPPLGVEASEQLAWRSSYIVWATADPHARAYQTLKTERAAAIVRKLDRLPAEGKVAPEKDARCVSCHATAVPHEGLVNAVSQSSDVQDQGSKESIAHEAVLRTIASDGIGCESCHGGAKKWLGEHFLMRIGGSSVPADMARGEKQRLGQLGMLDTDNLAVQAQTCVRCHVGERSGDQVRDMNHDMIAAGHPALNFEFAAYKARMPRHWAVPQERTARAHRELMGWRVGQMVSAAAALRLSADRASASLKSAAGEVKTGTPHVPWPEFSEYSCYRCHHALRSNATADSTTQQQLALDRKAKSSLPIGEELWGLWGPWHSLGLDLKKHGKGLRPLASKGARPSASDAEVRELVQAQHELAARLVRDAAELVPKGSTEGGSVASFKYAFGEVPPPSDNDLLNWDEATQRYLAHVAFYRARRVEAGLPLDKADDLAGESLKELYQSLRFDQPGDRRFNSPAHYDPLAVKSLFEKLKTAERVGN